MNITYFMVKTLFQACISQDIFSQFTQLVHNQAMADACSRWHNKQMRSVKVQLHLV